MTFVPIGREPAVVGSKSGVASADDGSERMKTAHVGRAQLVEAAGVDSDIDAEFAGRLLEARDDT